MIWSPSCSDQLDWCAVRLYVSSSTNVKMECNKSPQADRGPPSPYCMLPPKWSHDTHCSHTAFNTGTTGGRRRPVTTSEARQVAEADQSLRARHDRWQKPTSHNERGTTDGRRRPVTTSKAQQVADDDQSQRARVYKPVPRVSIHLLRGFDSCPMGGQFMS
jgi:hypothetical protein